MAALTVLEFEGADGSTTITDTGSNPKGVTVGGNAQIDTAEKAIGAGSLKLDGSGDYIYIGDSDDFEVGTDDFQHEIFFRLNAVGIDQCILQLKAASNNSLSLIVTSANVLFFLTQVAGADWGSPATITGPTTLVAGVWYYVKIKKVGTDITIKLSVDGINLITQGSMTISGSGPTGVFKLIFGAVLDSVSILPIGGTDLNGWLDNYKYYKAETTADVVPARSSSGFFHVM